MRKINLEIKARCGNPEVVRDVLRERQAKFAGLDQQRDTYFRVPAGRLKLRQGNIENALIYYRRPDQAGPKESDVLLHPVTAGDELRALLTAALGVLVTVEKRREIYYVGNVKFHLDQVSGLGGFVEIEACGEPDASRDALLAQCREYMRLLHIADSDLIDRSYSDLLLEKKSR
jgi:adenylate cyclase, class 2